MNEKYRILIISNECLSTSSSNGRTLRNFLLGWPKECIAQFFLKSAEPDYDVCENYCDRVAAEFLVPRQELNNIWNGDIKYVARKFLVSELVVARRAHDLGVLSDRDYRTFWIEYSHRPIYQKKKGNGGSFYRTSVKRVGRLFAIHVKNAVGNRQLSYTEAYRLTGLYGKTYTKFMNDNI